MYYLTQICKVTIAMFLIAMVAVLFSTLTGCRGCSSEEEVVRWVPAPRDTIPETIVEDSLDMEPVVIEEVITVAKPAKKKQPALSNKDTYSDEVVENYQRNNANIHLWCDEFDRDSITLTIITSEIEMEITQNLN